MNDTTSTTAVADTVPAVIEAIALTTIQQPGDLVPLSSFTGEDEQEIAKIMRTINFDDRTLPQSYGAPAQEAIMQQLMGLMRDVKVEDAGVAGDLSLQLSKGIDELQIGELRKELEELTGKKPGEGGIKSLLRSLPFIGKPFRHIEYFLVKKESLAKQFDQMKQKADERKRTIISYDVKLDRQNQATRTQIVALSHYIAAGERALLDVKQKFNASIGDPSLTKDPLAMNDLRAKRKTIINFEVRLLKLNAARSEAINLMFPQIEMVREAGAIEIQNIFDVILTDLPRLAATILNLAGAIAIAKSQQERGKQRETSERIQDLAVDVIGETAVKAAESQGDILEQVQHLAALANKLTSVMALAQEKERETAAKRTEAARLLGELNTSMAEKTRDLTLNPV